MLDLKLAARHRLAYPSRLFSTLSTNAIPGLAVKSREEFTWAQTANLNSYIGTNLTTLDPETAFVSQGKSEQTLDNYGNVTQSRLYNLNLPLTGVRIPVKVNAIPVPR